MMDDGLRKYGRYLLLSAMLVVFITIMAGDVNSSMILPSPSPSPTIHIIKVTPTPTPSPTIGVIRPTPTVTASPPTHGLTSITVSPAIVDQAVTISGQSSDWGPMANIHFVITYGSQTVKDDWYQMGGTGDYSYTFTPDKAGVYDVKAQLYSVASGKTPMGNVLDSEFVVYYTQDEPDITVSVNPNPATVGQIVTISGTSMGNWEIIKYNNRTLVYDTPTQQDMTYSLQFTPTADDIGTHTIYVTIPGIPPEAQVDLTVTAVSASTPTAGAPTSTNTPGSQAADQNAGSQNTDLGMVSGNNSSLATNTVAPTADQNQNGTASTPSQAKPTPSMSMGITAMTLVSMAALVLFIRRDGEN
jgi:hypothetical protein